MKKDYPIICWVIVLILVSVIIPSSAPRHFLIIVPGALILAAIAINEVCYLTRSLTKGVIKLKYTRIIFLVMIILIGLKQFQDNNNYINYMGNYNYVGIKEAGLWINNNVPEDSPLYVMSYRTIRFYSNIGKWDERIVNEFPETKQEFEDEIKKMKKPIYIQLDRWEYAVPNWVYPLSNDLINYFQSLGFEPVKIIERNMPTQEGLVKQPVGFVLRRE
jgi:hypothetical protein